MTKKCNKCQEIKPLNEFSPGKRYKDGYRGQCKSCRVKYATKYWQDNREKINAYSNARQKRLRKENPEKYKESDRLYRIKYAERRAENKKKWLQTEHGRRVNNYHGMLYHTRKLQRTPVWADLDAIKEFYKNCPEGYHVDHIIPLRGENVSGLHVLNNLQYLPAKENMSKGNKFDV